MYFETVIIIGDGHIETPPPAFLKYKFYFLNPYPSNLVLKSVTLHQGARLL